MTIERVLRVRVVLARSAENHQHADCCGEEYCGFPECVERTIIQNQSGNDVLGSGFASSVLDVTLNDFVVGGVTFVAEGRKFRDGSEEEADDHQTGQYA